MILEIYYPKNSQRDIEKWNLHFVCYIRANKLNQLCAKCPHHFSRNTQNSSINSVLFFRQQQTCTGCNGIHAEVHEGSIFFMAFKRALGVIVKLEPRTIDNF